MLFVLENLKLFKHLIEAVWLGQLERVCTDEWTTVQYCLCMFRNGVYEQEWMTGELGHLFLEQYELNSQFLQRRS